MADVQPIPAPPPRPPRLAFDDSNGTVKKKTSTRKKTVKKQKSARRKSLFQRRKDNVVQEWNSYAKAQPESALFVEKILRYLVKKDEVADKSGKQREALFSALYNIIFLIVAGAIVIGLIEEWEWYDSLWWAYITLSTLGYGDIVPSKPVSMWITCAFIIYGVGTLSEAISTIAGYLKAKKEAAEMALKLEEEREAKEKAALERFPSPRRLAENNATSHDMVEQFSDGIANVLTRTPRENLAEMGEGMVKSFKSIADGKKIKEKMMESATLKSSTKAELKKFILVMMNFVAILFAGSVFMHLSEDWDIGNGVYFAFETATTIGYGDQSSLYPLNAKNITAGDTTVETCLAARGKCVTVNVTSCDGRSHVECQCNFSDKGKAFLMIFSAVCFSQLSSVIDAVPTTAIENLRNGRKVNPEDEKKEELSRRRKCISNTVSLFVWIGLVFGYVLAGGFLFLTLEPTSFPDLKTAMYFCMVTLTTIGYGDFSPGTTVGKIVWIFYTLCGFAFVAKLLGKISSGFKACAKKGMRAWVFCCKPFGIGDEEDEIDFIMVCQSLLNTVIFLILHMIVHYNAECGPDAPMLDECGNSMECPYDFTKLVYSAVVTMSTVGYGAVYYPTTANSRLWVLVFGIFSLSNFANTVEAITTYKSKRYEETVTALMETEDENTGMNELQFIIEALNEVKEAAQQKKEI